MIKQQLSALTSLRFFAALFVFLSHIKFIQETSWSFLYVDKGYIGVTFFFILSGFILSYAHTEGIINKRHFYISRFARIYPLHLLTFIFALPFVLLVDWGPVYAMISNIFLIQSYIPIKSIYFSGNAPSWSISVEMFFYLLFPLLTQLATLKLVGFIIMIGTYQVGMMIWTPDIQIEHGLIYISPFSRVLDFMLGILLYRSTTGHTKINAQINANTAQIGAIFSLILFMYISNIFPIPDALLFDMYFVLPFCFIILAFARNDGVLSQFLSYKPLVILGEASFAFYLCHLLIIRYLHTIDDYVFDIPYKALFALALTLSVITSLLLYYKFEKPMKQWILSKLLPQQRARIQLPILAANDKTEEQVKKTFTNQFNLLQ